MSGNRKRSVTLDGHKTSVTLEDPFWEALVALAQRRGSAVNRLIAQVDRDRREGVNLSSALRLVVLEDLQRRCGTGDRGDGEVSPRGVSRGAGTKEA